jgi:hypothetical protein
LKEYEDNKIKFCDLIDEKERYIFQMKETIKDIQNKLDYYYKNNDLTENKNIDRSNLLNQSNIENQESIQRLKYENERFKKEKNE